MDKQAVQIIKDYVEGRMDITAFKHEFDTNKKLKKILNKPVIMEYLKWNDYNLYNYFKMRYQDRQNWNNIFIRYNLHFNLCRFLFYNDIFYEEYTKYDEEYNILLEIQPSWLDASTDGILDKIVEEMPKGLSKAKRKEWGTERIKELFKWDKTYPRWVQDPEWPVVDGKPLVFRGQERAKGGDIRTFYYFYDPETGKEVTVEQFT